MSMMSSACGPSFDQPDTLPQRRHNDVVCPVIYFNNKMPGQVSALYQRKERDVIYIVRKSTERHFWLTTQHALRTEEYLSGRKMTDSRLPGPDVQIVANSTPACTSKGNSARKESGGKVFLTAARRCVRMRANVAFIS
jgi:hypothetical protein